MEIRLPAYGLDNRQLSENQFLGFSGHRQLYYCCRIENVKERDKIDEQYRSSEKNPSGILMLLFLIPITTRMEQDAQLKDNFYFAPDHNTLINKAINSLIDQVSHR